MNAKMDRRQQRTARKLVRELKDNVRMPGFLIRLCRWEKMRQRDGLFTLQYRHD
ncbi:MAG: hypothetical protein WCS99_22045 [Limisphaerales bacterium]